MTGDSVTKRCSRPHGERDWNSSLLATIREIVDRMDAGVWVGLAGVAVAVVVGVVAFLYSRAQWQLTRRARIEVEHAETQLVRPGPNSAQLQITLASQIQLFNPYSANIQFSARRPRDITADLFNGRPLRVQFDAPVVSLLAVSGHPDGQIVVAKWQESFFEPGSGRLRQPAPKWTSYIDLPPALLSVNEAWLVSVICDGEPQPRPESHLTNVDWVEPADLEALEAVAASASHGLLAALGVPAVSIMSNVFLGQERRRAQRRAKPH